MKLTKIVGLHAAQSALMYSPQKISRAWVDGERHDKRLETLLETLSTLDISIEKLSVKSLINLQTE